VGTQGTVGVEANVPYHIVLGPVEKKRVSSLTDSARTQKKTKSTEAKGSTEEWHGKIFEIFYQCKHYQSDSNCNESRGKTRRSGNGKKATQGWRTRLDG